MAPRAATKRQEGVTWLGELASRLVKGQEVAQALAQFASAAGTASAAARDTQFGATLAALGDAQADKSTRLEAAQRVLRLCESALEAPTLAGVTRRKSLAFIALLLRHLHGGGLVSATLAGLNSLAIAGSQNDDLAKLRLLALAVAANVCDLCARQRPPLPGLSRTALSQLVDTLVVQVSRIGTGYYGSSQPDRYLPVFEQLVPAASRLLHALHAISDNALMDAAWSRLAPALMTAMRWAGEPTLDVARLAAPTSESACLGTLVATLKPLLGFLFSRTIDWQRWVAHLEQSRDSVQGLSAAMRTLAAARAAVEQAPPDGEPADARQARAARQSQVYAGGGAAANAAPAPAHSAHATVVTCLHAVLSDPRTMRTEAAGAPQDGGRRGAGGEGAGGPGEERGEAMGSWKRRAVGERGVRALVVGLAALPPVAEWKLQRYLAAALEHSLVVRDNCRAFVDARGVEALLGAIANTPPALHARSNNCPECLLDGRIAQGLCSVLSCLACLMDAADAYETDGQEWCVAQPAVQHTPLKRLVDLLVPSTPCVRVALLPSQVETAYQLHEVIPRVVCHCVLRSGDRHAVGALVASPTHLRMLCRAADAEVQRGGTPRMPALSTLVSLAERYPELHPVLRATLAHVVRALAAVGRAAQGPGPAEFGLAFHASIFLSAMVGREGPAGEANVTFLEQQLGPGLAAQLAAASEAIVAAQQQAERSGEANVETRKAWSSGIERLLGVVAVFRDRVQAIQHAGAQEAERRRAAAGAAAAALLAEEDAAEAAEAAAEARRESKAAKRKRRAAAKRAAAEQQAADEQRQGATAAEHRAGEADGQQAAQERQQLEAEERQPVQQDQQRRQQQACAEEQQADAQQPDQPPTPAPTPEAGASGMRRAA
eukprot:scaffold4.g4589.t1